jgi:hypothetical protein
VFCELPCDPYETTDESQWWVLREHSQKTLKHERGSRLFPGFTRWFTDLYVNFVLIDSADLFKTLEKVV